MALDQTQRVSKGRLMTIHNQSSSSPSVNEVGTSLEDDLGAISEEGYVGEGNEDSYLVIRFGRSLENLLTNLEDDLIEQDYFMDGYGLLVADGMGGMAAGDVASRLALTQLIQLI